MLTINYLETTPPKKCYDFAVQGNSNANKVRFVVSANQNDIDISSLTPYLKVESLGKDYLDKIDLTNHTTIESGVITVDWTMDGNATANRFLEVQLMFEDYDNDIIWQTDVITLRLVGSINIDSDMASRYPQILSYLLKQVATIPNLQEGDGIKIRNVDGDVVIAIDENYTISVSYLADVLAGYATLATAQQISAIKSFLALPVTVAGREYTSDRQLVDRQFVIDYIYPHLQDYAILNGKVSDIIKLIPTQASENNQLADKAFVNSSINNLASFYITYDAQGDSFPTKQALDEATVFYNDGQPRVPTKNDYCIVASDENHENATTRYIYTGSQWAFQWVVNNSPFTQAQKDAINSGITSALVAQIGSNSNRITALENKAIYKVDLVILPTDWDDNEAVISTGITGLENASLLVAGSDIANQNLCNAYGVQPSGFDEEQGLLTFTCMQAPIDAILISVTVVRY